MDERRRGILQGLVDARGVPLAPPSPEPTIERSPVDGLDALLEAMGQVADGVSGFSGIEIGPEACRELLRLIDQGETHRQQSESHLRLVEQARRERDEYLNKLSEVAKARDMAQHRADVAERHCNEWRTAARDFEAQRDKSAFDLHDVTVERDELRVQKAILEKAYNGVMLERDEARGSCAFMQSQLEETLNKTRDQVERLRRQASPVPYQGSAADTLREACRRVRAGAPVVHLEAETCRSMFDELLLEADRAELEPDDGEPPRHLHCCECEQCQPGPRGCVTINVYGGQVEVHS